MHYMDDNFQEFLTNNQSLFGQDQVDLLKWTS